MMDTTQFLVTPLSSVFCLTCAHWGGARVIRNNLSHSWSNFHGICEISPDESAQSSPQKLQTLANTTGCAKWMAAQSN
jgi:hypothetical protein